MEKFTSSPVGVPVNKGDSIIDVKHLIFFLTFHLYYYIIFIEVKENTPNQKGNKNENYSD